MFVVFPGFFYFTTMNSILRPIFSFSTPPCSGQRSDPTLSTADPESSPSPTPSGLDHVTPHSAHSPHGNEEHQHQHHHHHNLHGHEENGVVRDDVSSDAHGDVMAMPEYVNIFLEDNFRLDRYLIDGQAEGHPDTQSGTNNSSTANNDICDSNNNTNNVISGISREVDGSIVNQHHQQQHPPETVVVNVTEEITRPKPPKRTKSQKEVSHQIECLFTPHFKLHKW